MPTWHKRFHVLGRFLDVLWRKATLLTHRRKTRWEEREKGAQKYNQRHFREHLAEKYIEMRLFITSCLFNRVDVEFKVSQLNHNRWVLRWVRSIQHVRVQPAGTITDNKGNKLTWEQFVPVQLVMKLSHSVTNHTWPGPDTWSIMVFLIVDLMLCHPLGRIIYLSKNFVQDKCARRRVSKGGVDLFSHGHL